MSWDWEKLHEQQQKRGDIPPQMEEFINRFNGFNLRGGVWLLILLLAGLLAASSVYIVNPGEEGVVQRFGRYLKTTKPGLHFKLPVGIEKVTRVNVQLVQTEDFSGSRISPVETDITLMLTGDLNVALVPWIVQYRIKDPYNYLFKVKDVRILLRDMSEAAMRLVVGDRSIDEVISNRDEIAVESRELLQRELDQAETGIHIVTIEMKKTDVPPQVQPYLNEVNQASQEKEQMVYQAREEYNKAVPAAKGEAERTIRAGEGYAVERVNRAKGDVARFVALYDEYILAKDITRRRLYLETMREVLPLLKHKYIIDADQKNLLPLLNLEQEKGAVK